MSDSDGTPTMVGQYSASAPSLDPSFFSDLDSIEAVVNDIVYNSDGSKATLHSNTTAETWYRLETDVKAAETALADINDRFAKEIKAMTDALEGDAGDAFNKYATAILNTSEEIYSTLMQKQFATNMGGIGHSEQSFANNWWQLHDAADSSLTTMVNSLQDAAATQIQAATEVEQLSQISAQLATDVLDARSTVNAALLKDLQDALGNLGKNYNDIGGYLVPLYISDGDTTTAAPPGSFQQQVNQDTEQNQQQQFYTSTKPELEDTESIEDDQQFYTSSKPQLDTELNQGDAQANTEAGTVPSTQGEVTPLQTTGLPTTESTPPDFSMTGMPADTTGTTGSPGESTGTSTEGTAGSQGGVSPEQQQALADAKDAAGQAIDGLSAQTDDPVQQQALDDAKTAAQGAIDGLTNPSGQGIDGGTGGGAGGTGSIGDTSGSGEGQQQSGVAGGLNPAAQQALADAKKAAGNAIDGLAGQSNDPKRTKALEDAKQAAEGAIDGLTDPTALPAEQLAGGPADASLEAAKDAAGKAIDDLAKPGDSEARQKALADAKQAAMNAVGDIGGQGGVADDAGADGNGSASQADRSSLLDAKHEAQKAIDDLIGKTDDPERKHALEDAKDAMSDAIDKTAAPEHFRQVEDAKHAADKAIDGLGAAGDNPQQQQALAAAKDAAEKAIGGINDASELSGPEHEQALERAKQEADKAIDALCKPDDTPAERQALAQAKEAVNKAIDGIGADSGDAMRQFLTSSGPKDFEPPRGGLDSAGGSGPAVHQTAGGPSSGGGAGPLSGGAGSGGTPSTQGGLPPGQFDTQPFQGSQQAAVSSTSGTAAPGQPATATGGAPMGPMGGGGMGAGGGNQGEKEREPQIWMQADKGAWGDEESDEPQSHVLGRS
ncbi:hypothetical protein SAMN04489729_7089 [Amycolatopsis lurida]|uniref:Large repetitive protein n=1 Tax=Amycolatopsis lurida NRRL 2430 TaxID=1460371 RepID=A0A2P2FF60_AMYLU|nr:large repetitive protein [Amycolatopsis lurida]KFU75362.1 hypothetical protein BB31_41885 [Amycolatopsis lurida NRRL 2430]SEE32295.1 hypothetical protein SAMN04489729_7089 [Amycolatopsis lurida]